MGFDWEEVLGDMDYEDAVDMAAQALEKLQDDELELEEETQDGEADAEKAEPKTEAVRPPKRPAGGSGFMDGMPDEPVFD